MLDNYQYTGNSIRPSIFNAQIEPPGNTMQVSTMTNRSGIHLRILYVPCVKIPY